MQIPDGRVALFFDGTNSLLPSPEVLRSDLTTYIDRQFWAVMTEYVVTQGKGYWEEWDRPYIHVIAFSDSLKVSASVSHTFNVGDEEVWIGDIRAYLPFDYDRVDWVLREAMRLVMSNTTQFDLTSMSDYGVNVEVTPVDDKHVVITLSDTWNKLNDHPFVYRFAVRYP